MAVQTEWLEKDYYALLGVPETASEQDVTRAYRRLARELHPDVNPDKPDAEDRFKEVSAAYDVLGDAAKRKEYDELRRSPRRGPGDGGFQIHIGDLDVTVRVAPHRLFGRQGTNLSLRVPVTFAEATLGADIRVPTLDSEPVTLRIPAGTPSERTFRVRGRGVLGTGDLLVTVDVA